MAEIDLHAIWRRSQAASPGPFVVALGIFNEDGDVDASVRTNVDGADRYFCSFNTGVQPQNAGDLDAWHPELAPAASAEAKASQAWADATFVANARSDIDALLVEVKRLRAAAER